MHPDFSFTSGSLQSRTLAFGNEFRRDTKGVSQMTAGRAGNQSVKSIPILVALALIITVTAPVYAAGSSASSAVDAPSVHAARPLNDGPPIIIGKGTNP